MGKAAVILASLVLAGCVSSQPVEDPRSVWCSFNEPRRPTVAVVEAMTRAELDELNAFNAKGVEWCGWKP